MHCDILTLSLPETVAVGGVEYPINCSFKAGLQFDRIAESDGSDLEKAEKLLRLYYPRIPTDLAEAFDKMLWFYGCGEKRNKEDEGRQRYQRRTSKDPAYSFEQDASYIYAAFKEQYDIDLTNSDLHWWKFMALFESLNENTKMSRIMYYRKASTSGMSKDRRAYINEMKKLYKLQNSSGRIMTLEDRNKQWLDYIEERRKMLNKGKA